MRIAPKTPRRDSPPTSPSIPYKALLLSSLVLTATSIVVPVAGFISVLMYFMLALSQRKRITYIEAIAFGLLSTFVLTTCIYSLVSIVSLHLPIRFIFSVESLLATSAFATGWYRKRQAMRLPARVTLSDVMAVAASAAVCGILLIPIINQTGGTIAQFLSFGEDNASHYALTRYNYRAGDFAYGHNADSVGLLKSLEIYPQGFHINVASLLTLTQPVSLSNAAFIKFYAFWVTFLYSLFVFWFIKLCTVFARDIKPVLLLALLPGLTLLGGLGVFLLLLDRGFQTQIYAYIFLLAILYLVSLPAKNKSNQIFLACLSCVLLIGLASSWWLLSPVAGIAVLLYIIRNHITSNLITVCRRYWPLALALVAAFMYPIAVSLLLNQKTSLLNEPGGVAVLPATIFLYPLPFIIAGLFVSRKHFRRELVYTYLVSLAALGLVAAIGIYQQVTVGHYSYYFYKCWYTMLLLTSVLCAVHSFTLLAWLQAKLRKPLYIGLLAAVLILLQTIIAMRTELVNVRVYVHNWFPNAVEPKELDRLFAPTIAYKDILYVGDCVAPSDYISDRWSGAQLLSSSNTRSKIEQAIIFQQAKKLDYLLNYYAQHNRNILIIVDQRCAYKSPVLQSLRSNDRITVEQSHVNERPVPAP